MRRMFAYLTKISFHPIRTHKNLNIFILAIFFPVPIFIAYNNCGQNPFRAHRSVDSLTLRLENDSPGLLINEGAQYTKQLNVNLKFIPGGNFNEMFISFDPQCLEGFWEPLKTTKTFELRESNQTNTIYVKYRSSEGEENPCVSDSITHDSLPPELTLNSGPASRTSDTTPDFKFTAVDTGSGVARMECHLDNEAQFSVCQSDFSLSGLSDGQHIVEIRAVDNLGWVSQPISHSWIQDVIVPTIRFTKKPPVITRDQRAVFRFSGINNNQGIVSYKCQLDGGTSQACSNPHTLSGLSSGQHSFSVVGLDSANKESQPITYVWLIDTSKPIVKITSHPENSSNNRNASFAFQANDTGSTIKSLECRIDNNSFSACQGTISYTNLSTGKHDFFVRATDEVGNFSSATYTWYIGETNMVGCKTSEADIDRSDTRNAYPTPILSKKGNNWYYMAWVWRETGGVQTNHTLSIVRSKDLKHWYNTCGERINLPISSNSKTVLDQLPQNSGLGNNVKIGFDLQVNPIVSYHKFTTMNGKKTTQIYNAHFINNKWSIHRMTDWTVARELSGGGSLPRSNNTASFSAVKIAPNGKMYQGLLRADSDNTGTPERGTWILEYVNDQLRVTSQKLSPSRDTGDPFENLNRGSLPPDAVTAENSNFNGLFRSKRVWASYDPGWIQLRGDWNNDGNTNPGLFNRNLSKFYLYTDNGSDFVVPFQFGSKEKYYWPLVGSWGIHGQSSIGLWSPSANKYYIKRQLSGGPADQVITGTPPSGVTDSPLLWHQRKPNITHFIKYDVMPGNRDHGYNCDGTPRTDRQMPEPSSCWNLFHTKLYLYEYDVENGQWEKTFIDNTWGGAKVRFFLKVFKNLTIITYYDINRKIKIALRQGNSSWRKSVIDSTITFDGWDAHNTLVVEVDLKNNIHVTGNMHADAMKYWISNGLDINSFTRQALQQSPDRSTYPTFFRGPKGEFLFRFRVGSSTNGLWRILQYNEFTETWTPFIGSYLFHNH